MFLTKESGFEKHRGRDRSSLSLPALLFPLVDLTVQVLQRISQTAYLVDEAQPDSLLSINDAAHVGGHLSGIQHQIQKILPADAAVAGNEVHDTLLEPVEIVVGLRGGNDGAAHPHRMDGHGR